MVAWALKSRQLSPAGRGGRWQKRKGSFKRLRMWGEQDEWPLALRWRAHEQGWEKGQKSQGWPLADSQPGNGDVNPPATRNWIQPTTGIACNPVFLRAFRKEHNPGCALLFALWGSQQISWATPYPNFWPTELWGNKRALLWAATFGVIWEAPYDWVSSFVVLGWFPPMYNEFPLRCFIWWFSQSLMVITRLFLH